MKTPRDILLQRQQAVESKLDRIRETIIADLSRQPVTREHNLPLTIVLKLWQELILPCRRTWAGLATVWLVITAFNLTQGDQNPQMADRSPAQTGEMRLVFQEQRRLLAELVGPELVAQPAAPPRRDVTQPRSEIQSPMLTA